MPLSVPRAGLQRKLFVAFVLIGVALAVVFAGLLTSSLPAATRESASAVGLLLTGVLATVSAAVRGRWSAGNRRRAWRLLAAGGVVALWGNVVGAVLDRDVLVALPLDDVAIALALALSIASLAYFTQVTRNRTDMAVLALDGLILGSAVLIMTWVLVYDRLLAASGDLAFLAGILIPMLDVVLATAALILLRRTRGADRLALGLVTAGFIVYTMTDLGYAVLVADGDFVFGTPLDLGWMLGYLLIAAAAWAPSGDASAVTGDGIAGAEDWDTAVVFVVLLLAVIVEVLGDRNADLVSIEAALWVILIGGAGVRQGLIARDNRHLRSNLEADIRARTVDLRQMARRTEVLLTSVADGIYGVDADGMMTFVNPSGASMLGYSVDELIGLDAHEIFHAPADDGTPYAAAGCYIADAIRNRVVAAGEEDRYVRADGGVFPVEITASPLVDSETDDVLGGVVVFRDITQRHEINRIKDEFLSVVSHELRTPLTSIRGSLELLADGDLGELPGPAASMADRALRSSERLSRMISDILDQERIDSGNLTLSLAAHDIEDLLAVAQRELTDFATSRRVDLVRTVHCPARVMADGDRIVQALTNLISNAVKFSPPGSAVELSATHDGDDIVVRVSDRGRGIPADRLETIFDRFAQVDSSDIREQDGSGLGLGICRGIVERHGGSVRLTSEVGVGTTALVSLRAVRTLADAAP
ncbi:PAS domain S-box protein [Nocardioidaceae bacterium]|nr:PAS domain S-box protein [Nocardioidaceae bacterium]